MAHLYFGLSKLQGKLSRYAERFDLCELRPVDNPLPTGTKLARWRDQVPPAFAFSVLLPRAVAALRPGPELDEALAASLEAARTLQARAIVLATPPEVRPTPANRKRLAELVSRLPDSGYILGWQPSGIWEVPDAAETAAAAGLLLVLDAVRDRLPAGPIAYTRIRMFGGATQLGETSIARIADQVRDRREAFVVVDGPAGARLKSGLEALLERGRPRPVPTTLFRPQSPLALDPDDEEQ
ncbi:MAG: DUF72 domain-containing protein [Deltaproteobacteria bacterium]|jgi:uncharacterized protein YecE (DUF72 family)|nr:DUF72 domain-containing protein [Deltaproteobacteria bacterium]MBW2535786.1 DUF72 domain-containing protein [Deltaproteobacteria bacterium]